LLPSLQTLARSQRSASSTSYIPVKLHPKQQEFYDYDGPDGLFGGAAGGGKTIGQLASGLKYVHIPGYSALLLRRAYTHLQQPGAFIPVSQEWLGGTDARYNQSQHTWFFPSGARLTFGYLDNIRDLDRYQGGEYQYIGVDEATQIPEQLLRYLYSRLRKKEGMDVPLRMRLTANPGGVSHDYVKRRYILDGEKHGRLFIPSLLIDNPSLDREEYLKQLYELDPLTRQRLLNGDWDAMPEGGLFKREWFKVIATREVPSTIRWVRYWDMAATEPKPGSDPDWTAGALVGLHDGIWYIRDIRRFRESPEGNERRVIETAFADGREVEIVMEQEPGASGKSVIAYYGRRVLTGFKFRGDRPSGSKVERAGPFASAAEAGNLRLVEGSWIHDFVDEATAFPLGGHKDQVDAVSGAFGIINQRLRAVRSIHITDL
jgi:predicted phage terminase large subunit-like protein